MKSSQTIRILLLEDDSDDVILLRQMLDENLAINCKLDHAERLSAGLKRLAEETYDIILLDLNLPDSRGLDTLQALIKHVTTTPIIVLSTLKDGEITIEAIRQGAENYLVKGEFTSQMLVNIINYAIERQQLRQAIAAKDTHIRSIIENNPDGILVVDKGGVIRFINSAAKNLLGQQPDELLDQPLGFPLASNKPVEVEIIHAAPEIRTAELRAIDFQWNEQPAHLVSFRDITNRKRAEETLHRQDAILRAVGFAAESFLRAQDWEEKINEVLARLGQAASASRAGIFENQLASQGVLLTSLRQEWTEATTSPKTDDPRLQSFPLVEGGFERWAEVMGHGGVIAGNISAFPKAERNALKMLGICSLVALPIFVGKAWWGFIGFEECHVKREWSTAEVEALHTAANILGAAIQQTRAEQQILQNAARADALARAAARLNAQLNLEKVLNAVCEETTAALNVPVASVYLSKEHAGKPHSTWAVGLPPHAAERLSIALYALYEQFAVRSGEVIITPDVQAIPNLPDTDLFTEWNIRSQASVGLFREGDLIGALNVSSLKEERIFTKDEQTLLKGLADQAAQAITNARLFEQEQQRRKELVALYDAAKVINSDLALETVLQTLAEKMVQLVDTYGCNLSLWDHEKDAVVTLVDYNRENPKNAEARGTLYELNNYPATRQVLETGQPLAINANIPNADPAELAYMTRNKMTALLMLPLMDHEEVTGLVEVYEREEERMYTLGEIQMLQSLASHAAVAIENARLFKQEQLRQKELTALYDLSRALVEAQDYETILDEVTRHAVFAVRVTFARLLLLEGDYLVVRAAYPHRILNHDLKIGHREPFTSRPFFQRALAQDNPIVLAYDHPELGTAERDALFLDIAQTLCLVPLREGERVIGLLTLGEARQTEREPFTAEKSRLVRSIANQAATALHRAALGSQTEHQLQRLTAQRSIDTAIITNTDLNLTIKVILDEILAQLRVDAADILLLDPHTMTLEFADGRGFCSNIDRHSRLHLGESHAGRVALERKTVIVHDLQKRLGDFVQADLIASEGFTCYYGTPLLAKGKIKGVLEVFERTHQEHGQDWLDFLESLARQAAIAVDNANLLRDLQHANTDLSTAYDSTIEGWSRALDLRDRGTEGHSQRVTELTIAIAKEMGMHDTDLVHVRHGALLHDIGKMGVSDVILLKPGKLTDEEWKIMKQHPQFAFDMLSPITYLAPALDIPYCHHEKWDGTGYPRGLKGEQIPLAARIFAVADVYDALTSDRSYRKAWTKAKALNYIREQSGKHFDPQVVDQFFQLMKKKPR